MPPVRVLIVDDHSLVRAGIRALVEKIEGVKVIAETGDGNEVIRLTRQHRAEIVLLDTSLPGARALDIVTDLTQMFPGIRVIVLSTYDSEEHAALAFHAGAIGFLPKGASSDELVLAVAAAREGQDYLPAKLSRKVFDEQLAALSTKPPAMFELTPRQHQVLKLIAEGFSTREIAGNLKISVKTVETHRTQLMERLNIHDVATLVRYAIRVGVVQIEGYEVDAYQRRDNQE
jgi:DNA-binding NarL/FixJ family response regulator